MGKSPCRRKWQPTPVFLPEKSHGQRSLADYSPQGCKDTTEQMSTRMSTLLVRCIAAISFLVSSTYTFFPLTLYMSHLSIFFAISWLAFSFFFLILLLLFSCSVMSHLYHPMDCSMPGFPVLHYLCSLLKFMSIESVMLSNHLILCPPLLLLPSIFPSIRVVSIELALCIRWPKFWSFSFSISASNEYSGLISFRMDWLDLLAVQGTLKSISQQLLLSYSFLKHLTP